MVPSTPHRADFVLFPHRGASWSSTNIEINGKKEQRSQLLPVLMAPHPSTPTSAASGCYYYPSPSRSRQQETHRSGANPQQDRREISIRVEEDENGVHWSPPREARRSLPVNTEPRLSAPQLLSPESPRRTPFQPVSNSGRRRKSKVPPAVPEPPRPGRLPTPELSDVEEEEYYGSTRHGEPYSKLDAQIAAASQYIARSRRQPGDRSAVVYKHDA